MKVEEVRAVGAEAGFEHRHLYVVRKRGADAARPPAAGRNGEEATARSGILSAPAGDTRHRWV